MNVVAKVLPETDTLLCYFHIEKNIRAKCITDCRVQPKPKDVQVDGKDVKEVKEDETCLALGCVLMMLARSS